MKSPSKIPELKPIFQRNDSLRKNRAKKPSHPTKVMFLSLNDCSCTQSPETACWLAPTKENVSSFPTTKLVFMFCFFPLTFRSKNSKKPRSLLLSAMLRLGKVLGKSDRSQLDVESNVKERKTHHVCVIEFLRNTKPR